MGILTIPCSGKHSDGRRCSRRFWRLLSLPAACDECGAPTSAGNCAKCGQSLAFGQRACAKCAAAVPPADLDDVVWEIPEGVFARRIDVTLRRGDERRFLIPAGVAALALIDGKPRVLEGSSIDYWTVLRAQDAASAIDADRLREAVARRGAASDSPRLTVVLVRPGPFPIMLEFGGVPCADGVGLDVQIRAESAVRSVDIILRSLLSGEASLVALDAVERRVASEIQSAVHHALAARSLGEFVQPGVRGQLLVEVKGAATQALARIGLGLESMDLIRVSSEGLDEVLKERGAAAVERIEVEALQARIGNDVARREALLDHAERVETIEQKRKFVLMQAVSREAEAEIHSASGRERVAKHLRAIEHALGVERIVNDADLRELEATRKDEATYGATLRAIALRAKVAEHELEELNRELLASRRRAEAQRQDQHANAVNVSMIGDIHRSDMVKQARAADEIGRLEDERRGRKRAARHQRTEARKDAEARREADRLAAERNHQLEMIKVYGSLSKEHLMIVKNVSPELAAAIQPGSGGKAQDETALEVMKKMTDEQVKLLREQVVQISDSNKVALDAVVRAVQAARSGPSSTTNFNAGRNPAN